MRWRCGSGNGSSVGRSVVVRDAQSARRVDVLVDCPGVQGLFTYQIPADLPVAAGDIVMVPFGSQQLGGDRAPLLRLPARIYPVPIHPVPIHPVPIHSVPIHSVP
ncbi:MAG: hypothetical protein HC857_17385, partial [Synechococcales cyanobacterium RU_4_20]|nr:hypothetical protein [Synechococcales cyanobacterium RU_4_20]